MTKCLISAVLLCLSWAVYGAGDKASDKASDNAAVAHCNIPVAETELTGDLYDAGSLTSMVLQILSGNTDEAAKSLGEEISVRVMLLNAQREKNPCGLPAELLARIEPFFRVIAAANARKPIPGIDDNAGVMAILDRAVKSDPAHYRKQVERSKSWDHGIR